MSSGIRTDDSRGRHGSVRLPGVTPDQHIMRADLDERRRSSWRILGDKSPKRKAKGVIYVPDSFYVRS